MKLNLAREHVRMESSGDGRVEEADEGARLFRQDLDVVLCLFQKEEHPSKEKRRTIGPKRTRLRSSSTEAVEGKLPT